MKRGILTQVRTLHRAFPPGKHERIAPIKLINLGYYERVAESAAEYAEKLPAAPRRI